MHGEIAGKLVSKTPTCTKQQYNYYNIKQNTALCFSYQTQKNQNDQNFVSSLKSNTGFVEPVIPLESFLSMLKPEVMYGKFATKCYVTNKTHNWCVIWDLSLESEYDIINNNSSVSIFTSESSSRTM